MWYGSEAEEEEEEADTDSESDESEDEDGEELTPAVDVAILRTLARIKKKDPEIYNSNSGIFEEEQKKLGPAKLIIKHSKDKSKPITFRQVAFEAQLDAGSRSPSPEVLTHAEEQRRLRAETIAAFHQVGDNNTDGDDFLVPREKTNDELEKEEEEYRSFLEREVGGDLKSLVSVEERNWKDEAALPVEPKKKKRGKNQAKSDEDAQEFLMNYILNRGWIDRTAHRVPTYKEVISTKQKGKNRLQEEDEDTEESDSLEEDDKRPPTNDPEVDEDDFEEIVDRFESSYNFRFEEPDAAVIQTHPRNIPSLVRREDTTRKHARERRKQRKEEEFQQKREEVKRLKALKMKEMRAKLDRIGKEGGRNFEDDPGLQELDLEGDWDPEAHDRQMAGLYGDEAEYDEESKPTWDDEIDIGDIGKESEPENHSKRKKNKKKNKNEAVDNYGVEVDAMDADIEKLEEEEEWDGTEEMRKRRVEEYMDEVYGLEFNDLVGGMPTRFHYTHVQSQDFLLTPAEILMATDAELNEYMGIKKYAPYRKDGKWDSKRGDRLKDLKRKITERGHGGDGAATTQEDKPGKKRKGKKERMKMKMTAAYPSTENAENDSDGPEKATVDGNLKRKRSSGDDEVEQGSQNESGTQKKRRRRHTKKDAISADRTARVHTAHGKIVPMNSDVVKSGTVALGALILSRLHWLQHFVFKDFYVIQPSTQIIFFSGLGQCHPMWTPSPLKYEPPDDQSPNLQTALAFIDARNLWVSPDGPDGVDQMLSLFDESLEHRILPQPVLSKNQYREYVRGLLAFICEYKVTLHDVIESHGNSIVIHASSVGTSVSGATFFNEYMFVLHFKASETPGELPRIANVKEFVDSKVTVEFFQEERRRAKLKEEHRIA
ncbi:hypothetical protein D9757_006159 [Collybiopsis confluens]|uniref:Kri1-like C-terminal domain-containing protein n=1 Tax=Collybiopsis confluens TaxID=2823264 RepID=A0A8H5HHK9_9AGAR|nr:hypothetical protein D9757_006159 [Collybiopsis confluens]